MNYGKIRFLYAVLYEDTFLLGIELSLQLGKFILRQVKIELFTYFDVLYLFLDPCTRVTDHPVK